MIGAIAKCLLTLGIACNTHYYFVAQNTENCDLFSGQVNHDLSVGSAETQYFFPDGSQCQGASNVNYIPPQGGCIGQRGIVYTTCSDGRRIDGEWVVTSSSCTVGQGQAHDNYGNQYEFTFGHSAKEAVERVNTLRQNMGCAEIDVLGRELRVQGKILRTK